MADFQAALTRKIGPLPAWGWFGIGGAGLYLYRRNQAGATASTSGAGTDTTSADTSSYPPFYYGNGSGGGGSDGGGGSNGGDGSSPSPPTINVTMPKNPRSAPGAKPTAGSRKRGPAKTKRPKKPAAQKGNKTTRAAGGGDKNADRGHSTQSQSHRNTKAPARSAAAVHRTSTANRVRNAPAPRPAARRR